METERYTPVHKLRIVTAAALFDGHDASINIMRRILQSSGAEVIHLGHNRSVSEVVEAAIEEDAQAITVSSYQGGHMEYFRYMRQLLDEAGAGHVKIFGGGGGVIVPDEIRELQKSGIERIYSPEDGRRLGLQGMINDILRRSDYDTLSAGSVDLAKLRAGNPAHLARAITAAENHPDDLQADLRAVLSSEAQNKAPVVGFTGTGGAGKSSFVDELVRRFRLDFARPGQTQPRRIAVLSIDPTRKRSGGALLGDRIRMNAVHGLAAQTPENPTGAELVFLFG